MAERRRSARFALGSPIDGHVSVLQSVQLEQAGSNDLAVLSTTAGVRGEELTVRVGPSDAVQMTMVARTVASEPRAVDGRVMHRIQLTVTGAIALSTGAGAAVNSWRSGDSAAAVLIRRHPIRVVNLGRGGCLIELSIGLPVGTVAALHSNDRLAHGEPIRLDFVQMRRGGSWPYLAGAEFLSLAAPSSHSLRSMAGRIELEAAGLLPVNSGTESGSLLTNSVPGPIDILSIVCAEASNAEMLNAPVGSPNGQSQPGSPLALVRNRTMTTGVNETLGHDD